MKLYYRIISASVCSLIFHLGIFFGVSGYIQTKKTTVIYSWLEALSKEDLHISEKGQAIPVNVEIPLDKVRNKYFANYLTKSYQGQMSLSTMPGYEVYLKPPSVINYPQTAYLYLWEKIKLGNPVEINEKIVYNVCISSLGKIILSFPQSLTVDSQDNYLLQEYVKEAVVFLAKNGSNSTFFWTTVHEVIQ